MNGCVARSPPVVRGTPGGDYYLMCGAYYLMRGAYGDELVRQGGSPDASATPTRSSETATVDDMADGRQVSEPACTSGADLLTRRGAAA